MKNRLLLLLLLTGGCLTLNACSHNDNTEEPENPQPNPNPDPQSGNTRTLIVYFSCTNTTKSIAEQILEITDGTIHRIVPEVAYTMDDLNYNNPDSRANREQNDFSARPVINVNIESLEDYDIIFLGYPIWWGKAPKISHTFLESHNFSGKTIIPFCTSGSIGIGTSDTDLHDLTSGAKWEGGRRFNAKTTNEQINNWIENMNLNNNGLFDLSNAENGNAPTVRLNSGYGMPIVGLGTYSLIGDICVNSVVSALKGGYRKIDTANMYHNEKSVGEGIRKSGVPREEIFVCTKLYPNQFSDAENAIELALKKLDIGYIDLMLLHHPGANDVYAYKAMEKAVEQGKIRSIGLSNYYIKEMSAFLPQVSIKPALVQNEIHPYYQDPEVIRYMYKQGIVVEAWYPLGGRGYTAELFSNEVIKDIANVHGKTAAQVILRWDLQKGVVIIPGSSNPEHQQENISIFDFELSDKEMNLINSLNRNEKHDWY